ncbi:MAG: SDR family oxidoreductase [Candidatus Rokubacteria bacterium]|nr:SDR family oxidoreductase [Alphaproteobacteria bacterium]MBM4443317.1 SDR family oxidoreductase [Candidatus Rokubacteria bacterium]
MRPVALVTGGSRNIGWAIAQRFAPTHRVLIGDLAPPAAALPEGMAWAECDVRDYASCERLVAAAGAPLAALVHSAAITRPAVPVGALSPAEWAEVIDVNLTGAFHVMRAALEPLRAAAGSAVLISSRAARVGYAALTASADGTKPHYCAAKAGVISLTRSFAVELAPHGVRVNCVAPGSIEGDMIPRERWPAIASRVPLGRLGRPEEVAEACRFLCSPEASYITGHVLDVNGGTWMN